MKTIIRIILILIVGIIIFGIVSRSKDFSSETTRLESVTSESQELVLPEEEILVDMEETIEEDGGDNQIETPTLPPGWQEDGSVILGGDGIPNN